MLKKFFIFLMILMIAGISYAAPPSRLHTYVSGTTIESSKVTANEDAIFNYLQAGVDTYASDTILDAAVNSAAAISDTKLDLATIAQNVTFNGTTTFASDITFSGQTIADLGTVTTGIMTAVDIQSGSIQDVIMASGINIDGGTIDGTTIGAANPSSIIGTTIKANTTYEAASGTTINEFSTDTSLGGDSDDAVPTEKAVKAYADALKADVQSAIDQTGASGINNSYGTVETFTETVTSGNQVFVIACFYADISSSAGERVKLTGDSSDLTDDINISAASGPYCLQAVDTDASGSTVYNLEAKSTNANQISFTGVNMSVIEFAQ